MRRISETFNKESMPESVRQPFPYRLLFEKQFRTARHLTLITVLAVIALGREMHCYRLYPDVPWLAFILFVISLLAVYLLVCYFNLYWLLPRFLFMGRYVKYTLILLSLVFVLVFCQTTAEASLYLGISPARYLSNLAIGNVSDFCSFFLTNLFCLFGISVTALLRKWITEREQLAQLEKRNKQTEIRELKEQVNPDFLFDILGRTSVLVRTEPGTVSRMLLQLSRLLRYQLYDCNREKVLLLAEIDFLSGYLELERSCSGRFEYAVSVKGNTQAVMIPPLLFMPFVHYLVNVADGENKNTGALSFIRLSFTYENNVLTFQCLLKDGAVSAGAPSLQLVRQRIGLLYPGTHALLFGTDSITLTLENNG